MLVPVRVDATIWLDSDRSEIHCHEDVHGDGPAFGFRALSAEQRAAVLYRLQRAVQELAAASEAWPR